MIWEEWRTQYANIIHEQAVGVTEKQSLDCADAARETENALGGVMGEFEGLHVCSFHEGDYIIDGLAFEMHSICGPALVGKRGQILSKRPTQRFYQAVPWWREQGRRVAADGKTCIYDAPQPEQTVHIGGRHYLVVPEGQSPEDVKREFIKLLRT